jgi:thioredoxin-like negative regulator of GroEL
MDRLGEAAAAFQAALKKSPEFTEAIMGLAEISREQGNAKKAIGLYQRYLDLTPDGTDAPAARAQLEQLKSAQPAPAPKAVVATPVAAAPAPVEAAPAPAPQPKSADTEPAPPPVVVPDSPPPSSP